MSAVMSSCRSCGAEIRFVLTTTGKRMPIDAEPRPDGNLVLREGVVRPFVPHVSTDTERWVSHFSTCPQSRDWRRR